MQLKRSKRDDFLYLSDSVKYRTTFWMKLLEQVSLVTFNAEDGGAVRHLSSRPLTIIGGYYDSINTATGTVFIITAGTASNPCHVTAIGMGTNGQNSDTFSVPPNTIRSISGCYRRSGQNYVASTVIANLFDNKIQAKGGLVQARTTVANANYTVLSTDYIVAYTSISAARVVTLPVQGSTLPAGQVFVIKDESGSCSGVNTITITPPSGTIDGVASLVLSSAYAKATIYTNGTNWFVLS